MIYLLSGGASKLSRVKLHQLMVLALVRKFNEDGLILKSATYFRDLEIPKEIGRHKPDVVAESPDGTLHIGEAKVIDNLNTQKTFEQFSDFLNTKSPNGKPSHLHIIVQAEFQDILKDLIKLWKLSSGNIHIWTY